MSCPVFKGWLAVSALALLAPSGALAKREAPPPEEPARSHGPSLQAWYDELAAQAVPPSLDASAPGLSELPAVEGAVELDGRLEEPLWRGALAWSLSHERRVRLNSPARESTLFLMARTPTDAVFAFLCRDGDMRRLRATLTDRGTGLLNDDHVSLALDTFGDERHAYQVYVNPLNVQADSLLEDRGEEDHSFDFLWSSATALYRDGWVVEIRIPLRYLRYRDRSTAWRVSPGRSYPRDFQYLFGPSAYDEDRNCFLCQTPAVQVSLPERSARSLQLLPYTSGLYEDRGGREREPDPGAGLDVKYQPSPSWVLDATLLPDFSQVEADTFQVTSNLRFLPFFEERRPFFLERSDLFRTPLQVVHTRTVLDPEYGLRATGKTGRHSLAVLHTLDSGTFLLFPGPLTSASAVLEDEPSRNTLLRYRYDLAAQSRLGLLYADKTYDGGHNRVLAFDGRWNLGRAWSLQAQSAGSHTAYPLAVAERFGQSTEAFSGSAHWLRIEQDGRTWDHRWTLDVRSEGLRTDLGFVQQVGTRRITATEWYHHWPESGPVKDWGVFLEGNHNWRGSDTQDWELWLGGNATVPGETYLDLGYVWGADTLSTGLARTGNVLFLWSTKPSGWFSASGSARLGTALDYTLEERADQISLVLEQEWRLWRRLLLGHALRYRELAQEERLQDTLVQTARVELQLTPRLGLRQLAQLQRDRFPDPRFRYFGVPASQRVAELQSLLRFRWSYGTALYAGLFTRETRGASRSDDWGAFLKVTFLYNL